MSRSVLGAPLVRAVLVCALLLSGCSSLDGTGEKGYMSGDGAVTIVDASDRDDAIDYAGEDLEGDPIALEDFRGKPTVVNVWGAWCAECVAEAPDLVAAADELGDTANFVGIDVRDSSTAQALSHDRKYGVEYPSFYEPDGRALLAFSGVLTPRSIPATVVLDAEGRVAASILGTIPSTQTLVDIVNEVAGEKTTDG